jgi:PAS domain S-box-containing protein
MIPTPPVGRSDEEAVVMVPGRTASFPGPLASEPEGVRGDPASWRGEQQARQLADTMPHIVWTAGPDGNVDYFNARWYEYTGLAPEAALAQEGWRSVVHPDDLGRLSALRDQAVGEGQFFQAEVRLRDRSGTYRWHIVRSVPVQDQWGRVVRRCGTATDIDDRVRAEERFRFLAESIPHLVWTARPDGLIDYGSPRLHEYLGAAVGPGSSWMAALHPDDRQRAVAAWEAALRDEAEYRVEYRLRHGPTGGYRWFLGHALPQRDAAGRVVRWYGTCTDIDSQWRAQQEIVRLNRDLAARVDELETLFATVPISIAIAEDRACRRMRSNPAFERMLELEPGSNPSRTAPEAERPRNSVMCRNGRPIPPEDLPMQVAARTGQPVVGTEVEVVFAGGRTKLLYGNASPLFDEDGQPRGSIGAFLDMTEWRRVEAALKDREEQLRLAVEATGLGLFDRALEDHILHWSEGCKAIFGLPADAPITYDEFLRRVHPEDRARVGEALERARDPAGGGGYGVDYRCVRDDGTVRWVAARGRVLFDERDGEPRPVRLVGTAQDITARKEAEDQLSQAKEAAETASRAKDRFLAVLSHELRTPLAPVVTATALLEMTPGLPPEVQEYLAMIRRNIALETRLIDDLLDLSRAISGKLRLDRRPTHLNDLILHVLEIVAGEVHDKGLVLESRLEARPDLVDADPARLQQVIWNLVQNAAKFTAGGGRIRVATRPAAAGAGAGAGAVAVEVQDTGKGISAEALPSIFDAFEQGDPAVTQEFGGLGLGLSIAKAVIDRHGGTIRASSAGPGRGSCFTVTLPLLPAPQDEPDADGPSPEDPPTRRMRVLLVEDHADTARAMVKLLQRAGYHVEWAECVAAALELAASSPFDVIVSDLGLPDGNGYDLMRTLKDRHGARGIALSGFGMEGDILRGRTAGFLEHLVKPVDIATLDRAIQRIARLHQTG